MGGPNLALPGAAVSALAVAPDGDRLAATDPDRAVSPASNTKLVTTALALDVLGPDHRIETRVDGRGDTDGGVLEGDLVVGGVGAPALDRAAVEDPAAAVAERVDRVAGDLVLDCSRFDGPMFAPGRTWGDGKHAYGAPTSALAVGGNTVTASVGGDGDGGVEATVRPSTAAVETRVDLTADPGADESDVSVYTDPEDGTIHVAGRAPPDATVRREVPVHAPVRHAGHLLVDALAGSGVDVAGHLVVRDDGEAAVADGASSATVDRDVQVVELAAVESAPVRELVGAMNVPSDNFLADQFARVVAAEATGEGSWDAWRDLVEDRFVDLGVETIRFRDGSGLSRYDRVPARGLVALLTWVREQPWADAFFDSLPAPGEGTLSERLDGVDLRAKTGTLTGVRALSGRIERADGPVLFSVLLSDVTVGADRAHDLQNEWVRWLAAE
jgi:D-alanyl-D-alanine carboxypeptidase/D-alanyl-D-alanine-endopeptidase (penicillin-binding protein 4)